MAAITICSDFGDGLGTRFRPYFTNKEKLSHTLAIKFLFQGSVIKEIETKSRGHK